MTRLVLLILCCITFNCFAQEDTGAIDSIHAVSTDTLVAESKDTVLLKSYATRYDPRKALLYAAVLPGLGQVYTKKYWKLPLVYGGMGFIGYYINVYEKAYTKYKLDLYRVIDGNNSAYDLSESQLRTIVNRARRERDFMIILMGGVYLLQIIDAHVDAHLKEFDLNPNLQVRLEPQMSYDPMMGRQTGFSVIFKF
jgi:hypothetical protein